MKEQDRARLMEELEAGKISGVPVDEAEVYKRLKSQYSIVECYDPFVNTEAVNKEYGISLFATLPDISHYDLVIRMVNHDAFMNIENVLDIKQFL